jgi:outer membrane protein assembly factor BamA
MRPRFPENDTSEGIMISIGCAFRSSIVILCLLFAGSLYAEDSPSTPANSRTEQLKQARQQKTQHLEAQQPSGTEKALYWVEQGGFRESSRFNIKGFYPMFSSLSTGSGFAPGVRYWKPEIKGSHLDFQISGAISFKGYELYELEFGKTEPKSAEFFLGANNWGGYSEATRLAFSEPAYYLYLDLHYRHFPQEDFFGLGSDSLLADRTDYLLQDATFDVAAGYQFNRWLGAGLRVGFMREHASGGTDTRFPNTDDEYNQFSAPGIDERTDFIHLNSSLFVDYRDHPGNPHKGGLVGVAFNRFQDRNLNLFDFNRLVFDARQYVPLGSDQRVAALRFFTSMDDPDSSNTVPFYMMETLGGGETLRGFHEFRFRDRNVLYMSGEYRWEAWPALEFALYYDVGKVFPDRSDFNFNHLERSHGFAIRFKTPNSVFLRIEIARSREGQRIFFRFGHSF